MVDAEAIGLGITAFVEITLDRQNDETLRAFEAALAACPNVLSCHLMSGASDYLIRVAARDLPDFERLHANVFGHLPGVARIESSSRCAKRSTGRSCRSGECCIADRSPCGANLRSGHCRATKPQPMRPIVRSRGWWLAMSTKEEARVWREPQAWRA